MARLGWAAALFTRLGAAIPNFPVYHGSVGLANCDAARIGYVVAVVFATCALIRGTLP